MNFLEEKYTIHKLFELQADKNPHGVAVTFLDQSLTYLELNNRANQLARYIRNTYRKKFQVRFTNEVLVGIYVDRSIEMMIAILAVLKAGGAYVPLDPLYPEDRVAFMLEDSAVAVFLTKEKLLEEADHLLGKLYDKAPCCVFVDSDWQQVALEDNTNLNLDVSPNNAAYIIYTSGSTGKPKGVIVEHKGICSLVLHHAPDFGYQPGAKILQFYSMCFDPSVWGYTAALAFGSELVILAANELPPHCDIIDVIRDKGINVALLPPALVKIAGYSELPNLKSLMVCGEVCPQSLVDIWGKDRVFANAYGPTETTIFSTIAICNPGARVTIGHPVANTTIYILDEKFQQVAEGEVGELFIGGIGVARGYLNRLELTAQRFINFNGELVYKTGDLVRQLPNGELDYIGRNDDQVKIRGYRIELGEIETALYKYHDISQAVVKVWDSEKHGQVIVAYYTKKPDIEIKIEMLRKFLQQTLPDYMVPSFFVLMQEFPLTPSKKIDKSNLPAPSVVVESGKNIVQPSTPEEKELTKIWSELLEIPENTISIYDNFFSLGGHSLLTSHLLLEIKKRMHESISLAAFVTNPTVWGIAQNIVSEDGLHKSNVLLDKVLTTTKLDSSIFPIKENNSNLYQPKVILLTGVTGFLGIYLLAELLSKTSADVYCLVRAKNLAEAEKRLAEKAEFYGLSQLKNNSRVRIVLGDLEKIKVGLSEDDFTQLAEKVDSIYHCGAYVHHIYDYTNLYAANVGSTVELLKLAAIGRNKAFHYISTISGINNYDEFGYAVEDWPVTDILPRQHSGYALTKWASELVLHQALKRGFNIAVYRPGNITGDSINGSSWPEQNHALLQIKGCIQLGYAPEWKADFDLYPVDLLARSIANLSLHNSSNGSVFNMHNPFPLTWLKFISFVRKYGYRIDLEDPENWYHRLTDINEGNALFPVISYYLSGAGSVELEETSKIRYHKTQKMLKNLDLEYQKLDESYIFKCLNFLAKISFLPEI